MGSEMCIRDRRLDREGAAVKSESELRREEGGSEGGGSASGSVGRPDALIDASQDSVMCGGCRAAAAHGHRVVGLPCGHRHIMRVRCVVEAIRTSGSHAQLICGTRGCTARHGRRESLEAAVQADPGLRVTVAGLGERPDNNWGERREEVCYPLDQNSLQIWQGHSMTFLLNISNNASSPLSKFIRG